VNSDLCDEQPKSKTSGSLETSSTSGHCAGDSNPMHYRSTQHLCFYRKSGSGSTLHKIKAEFLQSGIYDCMSLQQLWRGDNVIPKLTVCYISILCLVPVNVRHQQVFVVLIRNI